MTPEEKKNLVTARLESLLDWVFNYEGWSDMRHAARQVMEGKPGLLDHAQPGGMSNPGLWEVIAPLIDSLTLRAAIENTLRRYSGMPLTEGVVREVMAGVDLELDRMSGVEGVKVPISRAHSSSRVWGGSVGGRAGGMTLGEEIRRHDVRES